MRLTHTLVSGTFISLHIISSCCLREQVKLCVCSLLHLDQPAKSLPGPSLVTSCQRAFHLA